MRLYETVGEVVRLPDGTAIPDGKSPTGYVMSPNTDLARVAADGRRIGEEYAFMLSKPDPRSSRKPITDVKISEGFSDMPAPMTTSGREVYSRETPASGFQEHLNVMSA